MSNFEKIQQTDKQYVANTYGRFPVAIERARVQPAMILTEKSI